MSSDRIAPELRQDPRVRFAGMWQRRPGFTIHPDVSSPVRRSAAFGLRPTVILLVEVRDRDDTAVTENGQSP